MRGNEQSLLRNKRLLLILAGLLGLFAILAFGMLKAVTPQLQANESQDELVLNLSSSCFATPIALQRTDPGTITSIKLAATLQSGQGNGKLVLNQTPLKFNDFGDYETIGVQQSQTIAIHIKKGEPPNDELQRKTQSVSNPQPDYYEVTLAESAIKLGLVMPPSNTHSNTHDCRLIVGGNNPIPLTGEQAEIEELETGKNAVVDATAVPIDHTSEYVLTEIGFKRFRIKGKLDGDAEFYLDPNNVSLTAFGEPGMSTLIGWSPRNVTLSLRDAPDPLGQGRRQFEIVGNGPRQTSYLLVVSPTENHHRLVIKRDDIVILVVPLKAIEERDAGKADEPVLPLPSQ